MNIKYLQTFIKVCELESFTAAAEVLGLTQPGISKQIQKLEGVMGVALLERDANSVRFTEAGRQIYLLGKELLALWDKMNGVAHDRAGALSGRLRIGASTIPATHLLPPVLSRLHARHPMIELSVTVRDSRDIVELIHQGVLDVGMVGMEPVHAELWRQVCGHDRLLLIGPPESGRNAGDQDAAAPFPSSWDGIPLILRESGSGTRAAALQALQREGVGAARLTQLAEVDDSGAIIALVRAGLGFAIVSELAVRGEVSTGAVAAIRQLDVLRPFYLTCSPEARERPLVQAFFHAADSSTTTAVSEHGKI